MMSNLLSSSNASGVAIFVHAKHTEKIIRKILISDRVMAIDIREGNRILRIISVYLSHSGYPWIDFEREMKNIVSLVMERKDQGKYIVIAGDFNLSLNNGDRANMMQNLCDQFQFQVSNGDGNANDVHNWTFRSRLGTLR